MRLNGRHQDEIRAKIKAAAIVGIMQRFFEHGEYFDGRKYAKATVEQVPLLALRFKVGSDLLRKTLPDLQTVEHSGPDGGPIETKDVSLVDLGKRLAFILTSAAAQS